MRTNGDLVRESTSLPNIFIGVAMIPTEPSVPLDVLPEFVDSRFLSERVLYLKPSQRARPAREESLGVWLTSKYTIGLMLGEELLKHHFVVELRHHPNDSASPNNGLDVIVGDIIETKQLIALKPLPSQQCNHSWDKPIRKSARYALCRDELLQ